MKYKIDYIQSKLIIILTSMCITIIIIYFSEISTYILYYIKMLFS